MHNWISTPTRGLCCALVAAALSVSFRTAQHNQVSAAPAALPGGNTPARDGGTTVGLAASGHVWTLQSGDPSWVGETVAVGNDGTQVFSSYGFLQGRAGLYSAHDFDPPTAAWGVDLGPWIRGHVVDSAEASDVHAQLSFLGTSSPAPATPVLRKYTSAGEGPEAWTWTFPFTSQSYRGGVDVTADGGRILAWAYDAANLEVRLAVFAAASAQPLKECRIPVFGDPRAVVPSADGSVVYAASSSRTIVWDVDADVALYDKFSSTSAGRGHDLSDDGRTFVRAASGNDVALFRREGDVYVPWVTHSRPGPVQCAEAALADDESYLVCIWNHFDAYLDVTVEVVDLTGDTPAVLFEQVWQGSGGFDNIVSDMALASDADRFALALWGDEAGSVDEVQVYGRDDVSGWHFQTSYDLPGSANAVDISADGERIAVASKGVHVNEFSSVGRLDVYDLAERSLAVTGAPVLGGVLHFEQTAQAGSDAGLLVAPALAPAPIQQNNAGLLYLDPESMSTHATVMADPDGIGRIQYQIPDDPALVGQTLYFQGYHSDPRRLTTDYVKVTILP